MYVFKVLRKSFVEPIFISKSSSVDKSSLIVKFMFSKKATKIDEIFTVDLTLCSKCQIDGEHFFNFHGLLRKYELYIFLLAQFSLKLSYGFEKEKLC